MVVPVTTLRRLLRTAVHRFVVVAGAVLMTLAVFLVLPIMEAIGQPAAADLTLQSVDTADVPPPPAAPEPEQPKEQPPEPPPPQLTEAAPPPDLAQLEVALNPGLTGDWPGGDFAAVKLSTTAAATASDGNDALFSLADLDQKPRALHQPSPVLTPELRRKGRGTVHILFLVSTDGRVENPIVQKSTDPIFDRAALAAIKQWKFEPGKRGGKPVRFRMRVPIVFEQS